MTRLDKIFTPQGDDTARDITKIVVMAVGGQGGGVLTGWIEAVARAAGRAVQATSVAGVAQRTGATIYYIEMAPAGVDNAIFSLAPAAGDVDVLIAAELMEAGRAIQRGFVTPDRTVLIASTHRTLAVSEKTVPGDGIAEADAVVSAAEIAARGLVAADMEALAVSCGSVISASLLGALAGSGALPFDRSQYEDAIRASGKAVDTSLAAFSAGFDAAQPGADAQDEIAREAETGPDVAGPHAARRQWRELTDRVAALPKPARDMAMTGLKKVVDFQDCSYGAQYLDHIGAIAGADSAAQNFELTTEAAKYVANAMAYDDVIRVADLKTRGARYGRINREMGRKPSDVMHLTDFLHPRAEEIAGLLPAKLGQRVETSPKWMARIDRWFNRGRRVRSDRLGGFVQLYLLGGLRWYRPKTRRHAVELAHIDAWLARVKTCLAGDYALAVEVLRCRRLIKGYSDTHARGLSKFDRVLGGVAMVSGRDDAADWARRLREAALQDEEGAALDGALATIESFTKPAAAE